MGFGPSMIMREDTRLLADDVRTLASDPLALALVAVGREMVQSRRQPGAIPFDAVSLADLAAKWGFEQERLEAALWRIQRSGVGFDPIAVFE
jgi:hypothetical protein